jgi:Uma2 family endonuclease
MPMEQPAPTIPVLPRHLTAERYFALVDEGVLSEDDRVELLEGVVVAMAPQSPRHASTVHRIAETLRPLVAMTGTIRQQFPLIANAASVPEPDLALVQGPASAYEDAHPKTALLVVEVADSSLGQDRLTKARIYAAAGIPQYLIVNLRHDQIESYSDPDPAMAIYRATHVARRGDRIELVAFPNAHIPVADLLPGT